MTCKRLCELLKSLEGTEHWEQPVFITSVNSCGASIATYGLSPDHPDFPSRVSPYFDPICDLPWSKDVKFNRDWDKPKEEE